MRPNLNTQFARLTLIFIIALAENKALRKKMGIMGRKRAEEKFNWNNSLNSMLDVYHKVATIA